MTAVIAESDGRQTSRFLASSWLGYAALVLVACSATWASSGRVKLLFAGLIILAAAAYVWKYRLELPQYDRPPVTWNDVVATCFIAAPAVIYLALSWHQEFPYLGDQDLHLGLSIEGYVFWRWRFVLVLAVLVVSFLALRRREYSIVPLVALAGFAIAGINRSDLPSFATTYSGLFHFLAYPVVTIGHAAHWHPLNICRVTNLLAIPAWLLVLRPRIIGKSVDPGALLVGAFLFFQKDVVYDVGSAYLEPWALVFLLTAGEHLVAFGRSSLWRVYALLCAAALIKDNAILVAVAIVAATFPYRTSWRDRAAAVHQIALTFAPFAAYFFLHWQRKDWRSMALARWDDIFATHHFTQFATRAAAQFGPAIPLLLAVVALSVFLSFISRWRFAYASLTFAAGFSLVVFFSADFQLYWTGYFRTSLFSIALFALALLPVGERCSQIGMTACVAATATIVVLLSWTTLPLLRATAGADQRRNFAEHVDSPIFLPIHESITVAEQRGLTTPDGRVRLLHNLKGLWGWFYLGPFNDQYPDLVARYSLQSESFHKNVDRCRCDGRDLTIGLFVFFPRSIEWPLQKRELQREADQCAAALHRSCADAVDLRVGEQRIAVIARKPRSESSLKVAPISR